jgi:hypothetical protein
MAADFAIGGAPAVFPLRGERLQRRSVSILIDSVSNSNPMNALFCLYVINTARDTWRGKKVPGTAAMMCDTLLLCVRYVLHAPVRYNAAPAAYSTRINPTHTYKHLYTTWQIIMKK